MLHIIFAWNILTAKYTNSQKNMLIENVSEAMLHQFFWVFETGIKRNTVKLWQLSITQYCKWHSSVKKLGHFAMLETCGKGLSLVNICIYYACHTHKIYPALPYSVGFKAPRELWNPLSKIVHSMHIILLGIKDLQTSEMMVKLKSNLYIRPVNILPYFFSEHSIEKCWNYNRILPESKASTKHHHCKAMLMKLFVFMKTYVMMISYCKTDTKCSHSCNSSLGNLFVCSRGISPVCYNRCGLIYGAYFLFTSWGHWPLQAPNVWKMFNMR